MVEVISEWPELMKYVEKLKKFRSRFIEKAIHTYKADPSHFNTLIHGDMWANNLLVKFGIVNEEDLIFVDFQFSCWTSPAIDLHHFIHSSTCETVRHNHVDELIKFYYHQLVQLLLDFKYELGIPTLQQFKEQYRQKSFHGEIEKFFFNI